MVSQRVLTEAEVYNALKEKGFSPTDTKTATGRFWAHAGSDQHIQVPDSLEGYYPDWMLYDLMSRIGEIVPSHSDLGLFDAVSWSNQIRH